jgi:type IV pilus assembly protein PilW
MNTQIRFPAELRSITRSKRQRGISLVETMVGLTLGLLVVLVITQVWSVYEDQKSRTASGSSAQESGLLALTQLEQDIRSAGAGLTDSAAFDCTSTYSYYAGGDLDEDGKKTYSAPAPGFSGDMSMVPVRITDGGSGSDTLTVKRGSDFLGALPAVITDPMPQPSAELNVNSVAGFADGDVVVVVDSATGNCTVMLITQVQKAALKLQHNPGGTVTYNPPISYQDDAVPPWPKYSTGAKIIKVGQMIERTYAVSNNSLVLTAGAITSTLAGDIVMLKAQYGIAPPGSQDVDAWKSATAANGWDVLTPVKVKQIKAVRLAIVARSPKMEAAAVTEACNSTTSPSPTGLCAWAGSQASPAPVIDLSADPNWQRYRYRVYETIIPIRNVIWAGV